MRVRLAELYDVSLDQVLWQQFKGTILISGMLVVGTDFRHFRQEVGISSNGYAVEMAFPAPSDYERNCLLYLPEYLPVPV